MSTFRSLFSLLRRYHFLGSVGIVVIASVIMMIRISDRYYFAANELHRDVSERWGAPITQPVPSVRYVESGSVFNSLERLPLSRQNVRVEADMSYRKRGLVYFSGFDFAFQGSYGVLNDRGKTIDVVFVYPLQMVKDQVLLSDLEFKVDGEPKATELAGDRQRLQWTGRLEPGESLDIEISMRGRGLDSFTYRLDPELPVREFDLEMVIRGGDGFDYAGGVLPATEVREEEDETVLLWTYDSLESGVSVGAILPSVKAYDDILMQMMRHGLVSFLIFFAASVVLFERFGFAPRIYQSYLIAAAWAFFFVLLPYLAAFIHFYLAYAVSLLVIGLLLTRFVVGLVGPEARRSFVGILAGSLVIPTLAVVLRGYTGLIYTFEVLGMLALLLHYAKRPDVVDAVDRAIDPFTARIPKPPQPQTTEGLS